jgi:phage recombination protein Bet
MKDLTAPAPQASAPVWTKDQIDLLKRTIAIGFTEDELALFGYICQRTGLDPFLKQIYAIRRKGKLSFQTGIDGYRTMADATHAYAGSDDPVYATRPDEKTPVAATVTVYKFVQGERCAFTATARWDEYFPRESNEQWAWNKMPYGQLAKVAEALALRKAFPLTISGLYVQEEMHQAETDQDPEETRQGDTLRSKPVRHTSQAADAPREALLREIWERCNDGIMPLKHAGMHKAIVWTCFGADKPSDVNHQPQATLEAGMPLYRHLTAQVMTWDRQRTPVAWIEDQQRVLAAQAAEAEPPPGVDLDTGEDLRDMPPGWLTADEQRTLAAQEEAERLEQTNA